MDPPSGTRPIREKAEVSVAPDSANRMSQASARSRPKPAADPWITAITGSWQRTIGEDGGLEVGESALQLGHGRDRAQRSEPAEVEAGTEVAAGAAEHDDERGAALLDQVQLLGNRRRRARVSARCVARGD